MKIDVMDYSALIKSIKPSVAVVFSFDAENNLTGHGTGFVYSHPDILVTCNHVLGSDGDTLIKFATDKKTTKATVVIRDVEHDIALLKFTSSRPKKPLKPSKALNIKEGVAAIMPGYPLAHINFLVHQGIISGIADDATGVTTYVIDGTVNPGNSGGPLIDTTGNVMGVVNAKRRENNKLIEKIEEQSSGALRLHGIDLMEALKALASNTQLGMGYAIPASYIPKYQKRATTQESNNG